MFASFPSGAVFIPVCLLVERFFIPVSRQGGFDIPVFLLGLVSSPVFLLDWFASPVFLLERLSSPVFLLGGGFSRPVLTSGITVLYPSYPSGAVCCQFSFWGGF